MLSLSLKVIVVLLVSIALTGCEPGYEPVEDTADEWEAPPQEEEFEWPAE